MQLLHIKHSLNRQDYASLPCEKNKEENRHFRVLTALLQDVVKNSNLMAACVSAVSVSRHPGPGVTYK